MNVLFATSAALVLIARAAIAQGANDEPRRPPVVFLGGGFEVASSVGEFADYVDAGYGLGFHLGFRPRRSPLGFRVGGMFSQYGSTTARYNLVGLVDVDVTTRNQIIGMMLGPELHLDAGPLQLYGQGGIGFSYFYTRSSVEGTDQNNSPFASTTNYDDFTFAAQGGGGVRIRLAGNPIFLDLGARYLNNGRVSYVTQNTINVSASPPTITAITSDANAVVVGIGVVIGLRGSPSQASRK